MELDVCAYKYLSSLACIPLSRYFSTSVKCYGSPHDKKYAGPPQLLLSRLYMPCCVKGEDRPSGWGLCPASSSFSVPKIFWPWLRSLWWRCSCPLRLANYSNGSKPCHCVVGRQQLSHPSRGWQSSSGWTAKSALLSYRTDDTAATRGHITPPSHTPLSPRTNGKNRNDCVSCTRARGGIC